MIRVNSFFETSLMMFSPLYHHYWLIRRVISELIVTKIDHFAVCHIYTHNYEVNLYLYTHILSINTKLLIFSTANQQIFEYIAHCDTQWTTLRHHWSHSCFQTTSWSSLHWLHLGSSCVFSPLHRSDDYIDLTMIQIIFTYFRRSFSDQLYRSFRSLCGQRNVGNVWALYFVFVTSSMLRHSVM